MQAINRFKKEHFSYVVACCLAGLLIAMAQFVSWRYQDNHINSNLVYMLLSSLSILCFGVACYKMGMLRLHSQMKEHAKSISFIPICSTCKQVRISTGDESNADNWQSIEDYLYTHSNYRFSHSICPDCADSYYTEMDKCFEQHS